MWIIGYAKEEKEIHGFISLLITRVDWQATFHFYWTFTVSRIRNDLTLRINGNHNTSERYIWHALQFIHKFMIMLDINNGKNQMSSIWKRHCCWCLLLGCYFYWFGPSKSSDIVVVGAIVVVVAEIIHVYHIQYRPVWTVSKQFP